MYPHPHSHNVPPGYDPRMSQQPRFAPPQPKTTQLGNTDWYFYEPVQGQPYYFNRSTNVTQWTLPAGVPPAAPAAASPWVEYKTPQGVPYYYNPATKQTTWTRPVEMSAPAPAAAAPTPIVTAPIPGMTPSSTSTSSSAPAPAAASPSVDMEAVKRELERKRQEAAERAQQKKREEEARRVANAERKKKEKEERERQRKQAEEQRKQAEEARRRELLLEKAGVSVSEVSAIRDAEAAFLQLLRDKRVEPTHSWSSVLTDIVLEPPYLAIKAVAKKKELFSKYQADLKAERERALRQREEEEVAGAAAWVTEALDVLHGVAGAAEAEQAIAAAMEAGADADAEAGEQQQTPPPASWHRPLLPHLRPLAHPRYALPAYPAPRLADARRRVPGAGEAHYRAVEARLRAEGEPAGKAADAALRRTEELWGRVGAEVADAVGAGAGERRQMIYVACERAVRDGWIGDQQASTASDSAPAPTPAWARLWGPRFGDVDAAAQVMAAPAAAAPPEEPLEAPSFPAAAALWAHAWALTATSAPDDADADAAAAILPSPPASWFDSSLPSHALAKRLRAALPPPIAALTSPAEAAAVCVAARARLYRWEDELADAVDAAARAVEAEATAALGELLDACYAPGGAAGAAVAGAAAEADTESSSSPTALAAVRALLPRSPPLLQAVIAARALTAPLSSALLPSSSPATALPTPSPTPVMPLSVLLGLPAPLSLLGDLVHRPALHDVAPAAVARHVEALRAHTHARGDAQAEAPDAAPVADVLMRLYTTTDPAAAAAAASSPLIARAAAALSALRVLLLAPPASLSPRLLHSWRADRAAAKPVLAGLPAAPHVPTLAALPADIEKLLVDRDCGAYAGSVGRYLQRLDDCIARWSSSKAGDEATRVVHAQHYRKLQQRGRQAECAMAAPPAAATADSGLERLCVCNDKEDRFLGAVKMVRNEHDSQEQLVRLIRDTISRKWLMEKAETVVSEGKSLKDTPDMTDEVSSLVVTVPIGDNTHKLRVSDLLDYDTGIKKLAWSAPDLVRGYRKNVDEESCGPDPLNAEISQANGGIERLKAQLEIIDGPVSSDVRDSFDIYELLLSESNLKQTRQITFYREIARIIEGSPQSDDATRKRKLLSSDLDDSNAKRTKSERSTE